MKGFVTGLLLLWAGSMVFSQEALEYQAVFQDLSGTVEVKAPGAAEWTPARLGQSIALKTLVSTGFKSIAVIAVGSSLVSVRPLTRLTVEELQESAGNERVNINLQTGRIRANVKPPVGGNTEFIVKSPTATASVRGTSFEFDGLHLQVDEGRVHFTGGDQSGAYVGAGQSVSTNLETGRVTNAEETRKENIALPPLAGTNSAPEAPATLTLPTTGSISARFYW
jgi:hypothetical protein